MPTKSASRLNKKIEILRSAQLARLPWVVHGFSTRAGGASRCYGQGDLNLGFTADDTKPTVQTNRETFLRHLLPSSKSASPATARKPLPLMTLRQIHSDIIHCVSAVPETPVSGDGLIASHPGILLSILTADCLPVILVDTKQRAVGVFHAGWRGTVHRIVEKGVGEMRKHFGTRTRDLHAAIGPGIRSCCYQVGPEVRENFESQFEYGRELFRETKETNEIHERYPLLFLTARAPGHSELPKKIFLDIPEANRRQLLAAGVPAKNISDVGLCTACRTQLFFSHRAEKGKTGRMMAVVGIKP